MIIPWNTDAPIYYFPWATIGLIVTNTLVFARMLAMGDAGDLEAFALDYALVYGEGWHPVQWVTSLFLHGGFLHLIGNMLFLWGFGLVVEGKLGWWKFLTVYLGLGVFQNAAEQSMTFWFSEGLSFGASAAVFGLMAMSLVWAPENEMSCVGFFGWRAFTFEIRILWLAILYIGLEIFTAWLGGFEVGSEVFHLFGAALGFGLGVVMLKLGWVDCENWDLFAVLAGRHGTSGGYQPVQVRQPKEKRKNVAAGVPEEAAVSSQARTEKALDAFRRHLNNRQGGAALSIYNQTVHRAGKWELPEKELLQFIELLSAEKFWNEAVQFLEDYLRRFQSKATLARLKLAQILIEQQQRPTYAGRVLEAIPTDPLPSQFEKLRSTLAKKAQKMIDDGVLELEGQAW